MAARTAASVSVEGPMTVIDISAPPSEARNASASPVFASEKVKVRAIHALELDAIVIGAANAETTNAAASPVQAMKKVAAVDIQWEAIHLQIPTKDKVRRRGGACASR